MIFLSMALVSMPASAKTVDKIVAIVNEKPITLSDVDRARAKLQSGGLVDDVLIKLSDPQTLIKDKNLLLNQLVDERVLDAEVKRKNLEVTIERVEQEIGNIAKSNHLTRQQLHSALQAKGVTVSEYQNFIKTSLERQSLIEREVSQRIRITDEDVSTYYLAKKAGSAGQVFEYTLSHILFRVRKPGEEESALKKARLAEEGLRGGKTFEKLAEQVSEDPNFTKGGALGSFKAGEMHKTIEDSIRKLAVGEVSPILKTPLGYQIIRVDKKTLVSDPKLENEREDIRRTLYADIFKRQFRQWLNQRRDEAYVRINGF